MTAKEDKKMLITCQTGGGKDIRIFDVTCCSLAAGFDTSVKGSSWCCSLVSKSRTTQDWLLGNEIRLLLTRTGVLP